MKMRIVLSKGIQNQLPMGKLNGLRIIELPAFKAVKSASQPLDVQFNAGGFNAWLKTHGSLIRDTFYAGPDFAYHEKEGEATWIWALCDGVTADDCAPYEMIEFAGGLYAAAVTDENDGADIAEVFGSMRKWVEQNVFHCEGCMPWIFSFRRLLFRRTVINLIPSLLMRPRFSSVVSLLSNTTQLTFCPGSFAVEIQKLQHHAMKYQPPTAFHRPMFRVALSNAAPTLTILRPSDS
jgi:hypothetical protein